MATLPSTESNSDSLCTPTTKTLPAVGPIWQQSPRFEDPRGLGEAAGDLGATPPHLTAIPSGEDRKKILPLTFSMAALGPKVNVSKNNPTIPAFCRHSRVAGCCTAAPLTSHERGRQARRGRWAGRRGAGGAVRPSPDPAEGGVLRPGPQAGGVEPAAAVRQPPAVGAGVWHWCGGPSSASTPPVLTHFPPLHRSVLSHAFQLCVGLLALYACLCPCAGQ